MDATRLARAVHLTARRVARGRYVVSGGADPHVVTGAGDDVLVCDCADYALRGGSCKHIVACRLRRGDPETLEGLRALVPIPRRHRRRSTTPGTDA